ncbi:hypothetical protein ACHAWF_016625 [Thalassiosira exigua]
MDALGGTSLPLLLGLLAAIGGNAAVASAASRAAGGRGGRGLDRAPGLRRSLRGGARRSGPAVDVARVDFVQGFEDDDPRSLFSIANLRRSGIPSTSSREVVRRDLRADPLREAFASSCAAFLLSDDVRADGLASQEEYAAMLFAQCRRGRESHEGDEGGVVVDRCPPDADATFESLPSELQLAFVRGACPDAGPGVRAACLRELEGMWRAGGAFGVALDPTDGGGGAAEEEEEVREVCAEAYAGATAAGGFVGPEVESEPPPTASPTGSPSAEPSSSPTEAPSRRPTRLPTGAPSSSPELPLASPGAEPPSASPAMSPEASPAYFPTAPPAAPPAEGDAAPFVDDCLTHLLSPPVLADGVVSPSEFAHFLASSAARRCARGGTCPDDAAELAETAEPAFHDLAVPLQLAFARGACGGDAGCADAMRAAEREGTAVGIDAGEEGRVREACEGARATGLLAGPAASTDPPMMRTAYPSASPEASNAPTSTPLPSIRPSAVSYTDIGADGPSSGSSDRDGPLSRGALIGMSFVVALSLAASCIAFAHQRPRRDPPDEKRPEGPANHFGIAAREPWGRSISALPASYANLNGSLASEASSFRDPRFVSVFGPEGEPIPQFNPNTAGAVVIGSVTIGGDSSFSSGLFANTPSQSSRSQSFLALGKISKPKDHEGAASAKDDLSSLSSNRSSRRKNVRYRSFQRLKVGTPQQPPSQDNFRTNVSIGSHRSAGTGHSSLSRNTVPMSHKRRQRFERRAHRGGHASLGDWRAVSYMTETALHHQPGHTDAAARMRQSSFFFDALMSPPTPVPSSDASPKSFSCQSVPNVPFARAGSSDAGSILSTVGHVI